MFKKSLLIGAAAMLGAFASPAHAVELLDTDCDLTTGCLFSGNATDTAASILDIETAYNTDHVEPPLPATISLQGLFKTADGDVTGTSGTFTLPGGGLFDFYAVKAGNFFMLYRVNPTNTVNWTTTGIPHPQDPDGIKKRLDVSHITAYSSTAAVPEPATWAMMLLGFGAIGFGMRRRRSDSVRVRFA